MPDLATDLYPQEVTIDTVTELRLRGLKEEAKLLLRAFRKNCKKNTEQLQKELRRESARKLYHIQKFGRRCGWSLCPNKAIKGKVFCPKHAKMKKEYELKRLKTNNENR